MSSQNRYRTLVDNLACIHDATHEQRTGCLQAGLTKVLETINPQRADDWQQVKVDSMRLLRVWRARGNCQGDAELADQILEALTDFATTVEALPRLEISERPVTLAPVEVVVSRVATHVPIPAPILKEMTTDDAAAIEAALAAIDDDDEEETDVEVEPAETDDEDEDEDEAETDTEEEVEIDEEVATTVKIAEVEIETETDTEEEEAAESTTLPEKEEEVVEPEADSASEAEEEEEEGVEVEKRTIRGREYWVSSEGILYAVTDEDEIGDEVGRINKEGRPVFLAPK
jgi:hypothetical protein